LGIFDLSMRVDRMLLHRVNNCAAGLFAVVAMFFGTALAQPVDDPEFGTVSEFVTGADEVPLMAGLAEVPGGAMVFDTPGGRILEVQAAGTASPKQVRAFYTATLPQLGWLAVSVDEDSLRFTRESEVLTIEVGHGEVGGSLVMFVIAPHEAPVKASTKD